MDPIRKAKPTDAPAMAELVAAYWAFEGIDGFDQDTVQRSLRWLLGSESLGGGWLAVVDGQPAGYLLIVHVFSLENGGLTAEIDELFVREDCRNQGLGQALLKAAESACHDAGCKNISLQIGRDNRAARAFYLGQGFADRLGYGLLEKNLP